MEIYSVIDPSVHKRIELENYKNKSFNVLIQWHNGEYDLLNEFPNINILVDSGAFAANVYENLLDDKSLKNYSDNYQKFIENTKNDKRIKGYFDMDFTNNGLNYIKKIRHKLFNISEKIIPVFHTEWGINEFKQMCLNYNYIAVCNRDGIKTEGYLPLVKYAHKYQTKVHGLGINNNRLLHQVPFDSVDSIIWLSNSYFEYYTNKNIEKNRENNKIYRPLYEKKGFLDQIKRQTYYKKYWNTYDNLIKSK